jgi:hypothetical protein
VPTGVCVKYTVPAEEFNVLTPDQCLELFAWCVDNMGEHSRLDSKGFYSDSIEDIVLFKMVWGGQRMDFSYWTILIEVMEDSANFKKPVKK